MHHLHRRARLWNGGRWDAGIEPEAHGVSKGYDPGQLPDNSGQEPPYLGHTQKVGAGAAVEKRTLPATSRTKRDVRSVQHVCIHERLPPVNPVSVRHGAAGECAVKPAARAPAPTAS